MTHKMIKIEQIFLSYYGAILEPVDVLIGSREKKTKQNVTPTKLFLAWDQSPHSFHTYTLLAVYNRLQ